MATGKKAGRIGLPGGEERADVPVYEGGRNGRNGGEIRPIEVEGG